MKTKTYPLTQEQFKALRTRLLEQGVTLPAEQQGRLEYSGIKGIKLDYYYDSEQQRLTLTVVEKPWIVPMSLVWSKVDGWIGA